MSENAIDLIIFVLGISFSAFFSASESALISIPPKRVRQLIEEGGRRAKALRFLADNSSEILTTILIGNNFVNIFVAAYATKVAEKLFDNSALSYSVGITTIMILIFGEIVPKTFGRNHSESLAYSVLKVLQVIYYALYPIVKAFMLIIRLILGKNARLVDRMVTKDDIEFMVNEAEKERTIDSKQIDLLNSILEFPTIKVKDIMVPRTQVHALKISDPLDKVIKFIRDEGHSRYPVYDEDLDDTIGFLHVKDISFLSPEEIENFDISKRVNPPFFVYEHMKIQAVFDHMNRKKVHLALVKDENGLVVGIVTLEDIMEVIFGEIQDEYDDEELLEDQNVAEGAITVQASTSLLDLDSEYEIDIPLNDNYSTLNGFLLEMLGNHFPIQGHILFQNNEILEVKIENAQDGDSANGEKVENNHSIDSYQGK